MKSIRNSLPAFGALTQKAFATCAIPTVIAHIVGDDQHNVLGGADSMRPATTFPDGEME